MRRLIINGSPADLSNEPIGLTWQYFDLFDPTKRLTPYTSTIRLPITPNNASIFGFGNAVTGRPDVMRDLPNVNYYLGPYKIIENGYLKVTSIDKTINANLVSRGGLKDTIEAGSWDAILAQAATDTGVIAATYANAINSLSTGTSGWLLPRTIEDPITSKDWTIYADAVVYHELWVSATRLMDAMETLYGFTFRVAEGGALVDFQSSDFYDYLSDAFTPAWKYVLGFTTWPNDWIPWRHVASTHRLINGEDVLYNDMVFFGGKTPWDFLRYIAALTCSAIYFDAAGIIFVPFDQMDTFTPIDLSNKSKNPTKYINLQDFAATNYLRYNVSDNLTEDYGQSIITADVNPHESKDYIKLDITLPGRYYNDTEGQTLWNTDYNKCSFPILLQKTTLLTAGTRVSVKYTNSGSTLTQAVYLRIMEPFKILDNYISVFASAQKGIWFETELMLNIYDLMRLKPYNLIRVNELGGLFYINKISNFDPYSGKAAKAQIIAVAKQDKPLDLTAVAKMFVEKWAADYAVGGVTLSYTIGNVLFTSATAGINFTGATSSATLAGDLKGTAATDTANVTAKARKDKVVFTGTTGLGNCTFNGITHSIKIITTLAAAVTGFVTGWAADYLANNVIVTSDGIDTIFFEMTTPGTDATGSTTYSQITADLAGVVSVVQANVVAVARQDSVLFSGTKGIMNITCNGLTRPAGFKIGL